MLVNMGLHRFPVGCGMNEKISSTTISLVLSGFLRKVDWICPMSCVFGVEDCV